MCVYAHMCVSVTTGYQNQLFTNGPGFILGLFASVQVACPSLSLKKCGQLKRP